MSAGGSYGLPHDPASHRARLRTADRLRTDSKHGKFRAASTRTQKRIVVPANCLDSPPRAPDSGVREKFRGLFPLNGPPHRSHSPRGRRGPGPPRTDAPLLRVHGSGGDIRRRGDRSARPGRCHRRPSRPGPAWHVGDRYPPGNPRHVPRARGCGHLGPRDRDGSRRCRPPRGLRLRRPALRFQGPEPRPPHGTRPDRPAPPSAAPRGGAQGPRPVSRDRRTEPGDQARARPGQQGRADALPRPDPGGERHRQGARRPRPAREQPARERAPHDRRLRRPPGHPPRERALRPRAWRVHRRSRSEARAPRDGATRAPCSWTRSAR